MVIKIVHDPIKNLWNTFLASSGWDKTHPSKILDSFEAEILQEIKLIRESIPEKENCPHIPLNDEIFTLYQKYQIEPYCRCCNRPYLFGKDRTLICPTTGFGVNSLTHLRKEIENKPHVSILYGHPPTPQEYIKEMKLFNEETVRNYLEFFCRQKRFSYTEKDRKKLFQYFNELIAELPNKIMGKSWTGDLHIDLEKYTTTFELKYIPKKEAT